MQAGPQELLVWLQERHPRQAVSWCQVQREVVVPLKGNLVAVLICTEELFAAFGWVKVRLGTAEPVAWYVAAEVGGQDLTDTAGATAAVEAVEGWDAVQARVQPDLLHNWGDDRRAMEMEVQQMHRRTGLKNDRCSFVLLTGDHADKQAEGNVPGGGWRYIWFCEGGGC